MYINEVENQTLYYIEKIDMLLKEYKTKVKPKKSKKRLKYPKDFISECKELKKQKINSAKDNYYENITNDSDNLHQLKTTNYNFNSEVSKKIKALSVDYCNLK